jgi:hypothetical protein
MIVLETVERIEKLAVEEKISEAFECLDFIHSYEEHECNVSHALNVANVGAVNL